ncbi:MAG: recombinase family protein [Eubacterium sp.]
MTQDIDVQKVLIYLRKSRSDGEFETVEEVLHRHETILQEYALKTFGKIIPAANVFREVVSGETIEARPEIKKILSLVANNDYYGVLVVEPQRLTRGDMLDCGTIIRVFKYNNVKVLTPTKEFDLTEQYDKKFFEMTLTQGNDYLEYTKMILNRGRIASVKEGNFIGNTAPFGYDKCKIEKHHTLTPNDDASIVKLIFDLYVNKDLGCNQIASELDRRGIKPQHNEYWSPASIREMLRNPVYIGKIRWNNKKTVKTTDEYGNTKSKRTRNSPELMIIDGIHPAIIEEEIYNKAQVKSGRNSRVPGNYEIRNPFATLIKCGNCGHAITLRTYKNKDGSQRCSPRLLCIHQTHCHTPSVEYNDFLNAFIDLLQLRLDDINFKLKNDNDNAVELQENILKGLKKELAGLEQQQSKLYDLLEKGIYTDELFLERNAKLAIRRKELNEAIDIQSKELPKVINYREQAYKLSYAIDILNNPDITAKEKNSFLKSFIKRIDYNCVPEKGNRWKISDFSLDIYFH